jgi:hypothetical protein
MRVRQYGRIGDVRAASRSCPAQLCTISRGIAFLPGAALHDFARHRVPARRSSARLRAASRSCPAQLCTITRGIALLPGAALHDFARHRVPARRSSARFRAASRSCPAQLCTISPLNSSLLISGIHSSCHNGPGNFEHEAAAAEHRTTEPPNHRTRERAHARTKNAERVNVPRSARICDHEDLCTRHGGGSGGRRSAALRCGRRSRRCARWQRCW